MSKVPAPIEILDYDASWPQRFAAEREAMVAALGEAMDGVAGIEHVGSTSVSGCAAKPVIDIMVGVRALAQGVRCITPIVSLGYDCVGEYGIPGRIYFRKGRPRTHHVHLVEQGSDFWSRHLAFRDALRARPELVERYSALKRELAARFGSDRVGYTEAKTPFVEGVLAEAGWRAPQ
jgi:GrpB-like predicted nucleotidyltransferase (UPF0157 family)